MSRGAADATPATATPIELWTAGLDQFERRMHEFGSVLDGEGRPVSGLWPPPDLIDVPMPAECAYRARALLEQARQLEGRLTARRDELPTPGPISRHRRTRPHFSFQADL